MNLDILWTWAVVEARKSFLHSKIYSQHALLCSALAAKKQYPEARRRFLVDQETYDLLEQKGWLGCWDSVEVISFPKDRTSFQNYYASPKIYTYRFVENPTLIMDVEAVLKQRVTLDPKYLDRVQGPSWPFSEEDFIVQEGWFKKHPAYQRDFYPILGNRFISAAHLYLPSREVGEYASNRCLEHIDKIFEVCKINYGGGTAMYIEDGYITHCFEERGGVVFQDEWWNCFYHNLLEKHRNGDNVNIILEQYTDCKVYETYFKSKPKKIL